MNLNEKITKLICDFAYINFDGEVFISRDETDRTVKNILDLVISTVSTHQEGEELGYCDTGADMDMQCRSECVEMAIKRLRN